MRIVTLMENSALPGLAAEHGLSLYIEFGQTRILFDAGQSGAFAHNARALGVDLGQVDFAVLSHGHYDHGGGLTRFLELNDHAPIYVNQYAFGEHYNALDKYIGLAPELKESGRLIFVKEDFSPVPGVTLTDCAGLPPSEPVEPFGLQMARLGRKIPEDFRHEQYMILEEGTRRVVLSGCSHRGVVNIARWLRPDILVGGFHFMKLDPGSPRLEAAARSLLAGDTVYYTGHCTGEAQYRELKTIMGERLHPMPAGTVMEL